MPKATTTQIREALQQGLIAAAATVAGPKVLVFPGEPAASYQASGCMWVGKIKARESVENLGNDPDNFAGTAEVWVWVSAAIEHEEHMRAYTDAQSRVDALLDAVKAWLKAHQDLGGTCEYIDDLETEPTPAQIDGGWGVEAYLKFTAHYEPATAP